MKSTRQFIIEFAALNHDEDLLEIIEEEWLVKAVPASKLDTVDKTVEDRVGMVAARSIVAHKNQTYSSHAMSR